ncbi:MAG: MFS transporter [Planctomycetaceae bacterium]
MSDGMQQPVIGRRWGIVAFLMMIAFMAHFNRISISVAGTERLIEQYGFSTTEMGFVYSAFLMMYTIFMTPGGWLIDKIGAVKALAIMGFSFALLEATSGIVSMFPIPSSVLIALIVVRGVAGITSAPLHPGASRVVSRWLPLAEQPFANGLVTAAALLGISSTFYLFGWFMDEFGWPMAFVIAGGMMLIVITGWTLFAREFPAPERAEVPPDVEDDVYAERSSRPKNSLAQTLELLRDKNLLCLTLSYSAVGYFQYVFFYWVEHYYTDTLHLSTEMSRTYSTISLLAMAAGMFGGGYVIRHLTRMKLRISPLALIPILGMSTSAVCVILGGYATEPKVVLIWFMLALAGIGMCEGPMWTLAVKSGRQHGGTAAGIFNTGGNLGGIIAPVLTPHIGEQFGWDKSLWIASAFCVFGAIMWIWIDPDEKPEVEPEPS